MKKALMFCFLLGAMVCTRRVEAQVKIGYIDMQELIQSMPETRNADSALQKFANQLQQQIQSAQQEYQNKLIAYQQQADTLSDAIKEIRTRELSNMQKNLQDLSQAAQDSYQQKNQQLLQPIIEKAQKAVQEVAKEKGYTYVFNKQQDILIVAPAADDLLPAVKAKLGIK